MADIFTFAGTEITSDAEILTKFSTGVIGGSGWTFDPTKGIKGNGAVVCGTDDTRLSIRVRETDAAGIENKIRVMFWYKGYGASIEDTLLEMGDSTANQGKLLLKVTSTGTLQMTQASGSKKDIATTTVHDDNFHCIEVEVTAHLSVGTFKVWIDGVKEIDYLGNTLGTTVYNHDNLDVVSFMTPNNGGEISSIKIWDDNPGGLTGDLGNETPYVYSHTILASGDVGSFTAVGAATDWEAIDEPGIYDEDATYIEGYNGDQALFQISNLPGTVISVLSTSIEAVAKSEAGNTINLEVQNKLSGGSITTIGTSTIHGTNSYKRYEQGVDNLLVADVNGMQVGVKLTAVP